MSNGRLVVVSDFDDVMCNTVINWGIENNIPLETLQHREFWSVDKSLGQELGTYVGGIDYQYETQYGWRTSLEVSPKRCYRSVHHFSNHRQPC